MAKKKNFTYLIIILIILIIVGGGVATYFYYPEVITKFKNIFSKPTITEMSKNVDSISTPKKDTTKTDTLEKFVDKSTEKKTALSIKHNSPKLKDNTSFYIISGSFKTFERASIYAKQLKKEGYAAEVIQFDQALFRVSLGEFKTKPEALAKLDKIRATKGADAVWLLTKKL